MRVLILGGGGNIGFWVEKLFMENHHAVCSLQRGFNKLKRNHSDEQKNFFIIREDVNALSEMSKKLINDFDLIIDFICYDAATAQERVRLLSGFSGLFIMISTVAVYDRSFGINTLSSVSSCEFVKWEYAKNKFEAENVLLAGIGSDQIKICRLGHTFDIALPVPFGSGDWTIVQWLLDGNSLMLCRDSESSWPLLHARDAARRILITATEPQRFANVVNVVNSKATSWLVIAKTFCTILGLPESFRYISVETLRALYPYWSESVIFHKQFDEVYVGEEITEFSQTEVGDWSLETGLRVSLGYYFSEKSFQIVNQFDYLQFSLLARKSQALEV
jgi:nucleoside-diphosphate-sugar epimerase